MGGYDSFRSMGPIMENVHITGLRAALWRCDLGAELPLLAGISCSEQREYLNPVPSLTQGGEPISIHDGH